MDWIIFFVSALASIITFAGAVDFVAYPNPVWTNSWAVGMEPGTSLKDVNDVASSAGLENLGLVRDCLIVDALNLIMLYNRWGISRMCTNS